MEVSESSQKRYALYWRDPTAMVFPLFFASPLREDLSIAKVA